LRSEATKAQPRTEDGTQLAEKTGTTSEDVPPDKKRTNKTDKDVAEAAGVSEATAARHDEDELLAFL